jgi:hypothetical protein
VFGVLTKNLSEVEAALRKAATSPKTVVTVLDHAAKLNREIGAADAAGSAPTIINFHTNVNFMALKAAAVRATPVAPAAPPALEAPSRRRCGPNQPPSSA